MFDDVDVIFRHDQFGISVICSFRTENIIFPLLLLNFERRGMNAKIHV